MTRYLGILIAFIGFSVLMFLLWHQNGTAWWEMMAAFMVVVLGIAVDGFFLIKRSKEPGFNPWSEF